MKIGFLFEWRAHTEENIFFWIFFFSLLSILCMEYEMSVASKNGEITMIWIHRMYESEQKYERMWTRKCIKFKREMHLIRGKESFYLTGVAFFFLFDRECLRTCACVVRDCRFNMVIMLMKYRRMSVNLHLNGSSMFWSCIRPQLLILLVKFDFHHNETPAGHNFKV